MPCGVVQTERRSGTTPKNAEPIFACSFVGEEIFKKLKNLNIFQEYKREKLAAERARKNSLGTVCPRRKLLLQTGVLNFRPPVSRSRSAPRLGSIDEEDEEECPQILAVKTAQNVPTLEVKCEEEDEEEFSDLDAHSLNLDAHYRTTPALSGDSASQQSAPSAASSTCGDSKRDETEEESSGFQQQDGGCFL